MPTISETCTAADAEMTQMAVFLSPQDVSVYYYMKMETRLCSCEVEKCCTSLIHWLSN